MGTLLEKNKPHISLWLWAPGTRRGAPAIFAFDTPCIPFLFKCQLSYHAHCIPINKTLYSSFRMPAIFSSPLYINKASYHSFRLSTILSFPLSLNNAALCSGSAASSSKQSDNYVACRCHKTFYREQNNDSACIRQHKEHCIYAHFCYGM